MWYDRWRSNRPKWPVARISCTIALKSFVDSIRIYCIHQAHFGTESNTHTHAYFPSHCHNTARGHAQTCLVNAHYNIVYNMRIAHTQHTHATAEPRNNAYTNWNCAPAKTAVRVRLGARVGWYFWADWLGVCVCVCLHWVRSLIRFSKHWRFKSAGGPQKLNEGGLIPDGVTINRSRRHNKEYVNHKRVRMWNVWNVWPHCLIECYICIWR